MYMSYNKYLQQKADFPLYLATANTNQTGNLQAELSDRNNNVTQGNPKKVSPSVYGSNDAQSGIIYCQKGMKIYSDAAATMTNACLTMYPLKGADR